MKKVLGLVIAAALVVALPMAVAVPAWAQEGNDPTVEVIPADGATVEVGPDDSFLWTVDAFDESALVELEVDNNWEPFVPQFTVIANEADPYDGQKAAYDAVEATVTYDFDDQKWVIGFGNITQFILAQGGITLYIEVDDIWGNQFGDMFNPTPEMTFTYAFELGPYNKQSCKKGGWKNFIESHGFRNQGRCVKYVNRRDR